MPIVGVPPVIDLAVPNLPSREVSSVLQERERQPYLQVGNAAGKEGPVRRVNERKLLDHDVRGRRNNHHPRAILGPYQVADERNTPPLAAVAVQNSILASRCEGDVLETLEGHARERVRLGPRPFPVGRTFRCWLSRAEMHSLTCKVGETLPRPFVYVLLGVPCRCAILEGAVDLNRNRLEVARLVHTQLSQQQRKIGRFCAPESLP